MHQPCSKGKRSTAKFTSLSQQEREVEAAAWAQPSCTEWERKERGGSSPERQQGRQARMAKPTYQTALCSEEHKTSTSALKELGGGDSGSHGVSFSRAGHIALCDKVQKHQSWERLLAHLLLQLCTPVIQKLCARAALLLDTSAYLWTVSTDSATSPWWSIFSLPPQIAQLNTGDIAQWNGWAKGSLNPPGKTWVTFSIWSSEN